MAPACERLDADDRRSSTETCGWNNSSISSLVERAAKVDASRSPSAPHYRASASSSRTGVRRRPLWPRRVPRSLGGAGWRHRRLFGRGDDSGAAAERHDVVARHERPRQITSIIWPARKRAFAEIGRGREQHRELGAGHGGRPSSRSCSPRRPVSPKAVSGRGAGRGDRARSCPATMSSRSPAARRRGVASPATSLRPAAPRQRRAGRGQGGRKRRGPDARGRRGRARARSATGSRSISGARSTATRSRSASSRRSR